MHLIQRLSMLLSYGVKLIWLFYLIKEGSDFRVNECLTNQTGKRRNKNMLLNDMTIKQSLKKNLLKGGVAAVLLGSLLLSISVAEANAPDINAEASMTVDFATGQILQADNIDQPMGIASMTKMIVEYIVFEELEAGNLSWDTEISISDYAYRISQNYNLSNVPLRSDDTYSLQELYEAMTIYSANGATIAIAEHIAGSEPAFVDRMRETIEGFGIEDATLYNATGLDREYLGENVYPSSSNGDENRMSARSIAKITNRIVEDYPEILEVASIPTKTFREGTVDAIDMVNWNRMLEGLSHYRPGVDGLKTGTTDIAGYTFTGTALEEGRRLLTVVMGVDGDIDERFVETDKQLDYGFKEFELQNILEPWEQVYEYSPLVVTNGKEKIVNYAPSETELELYVHRDDNIEEGVTYTIEWDENIVTDEGTIEAPFDEGMQIGQLVVNYSGDEGYLNEEERNVVPIVTTEGVEKANFIAVAWNWISGVFDSITSRF